MSKTKTYFDLEARPGEEGITARSTNILSARLNHLRHLAVQANDDPEHATEHRAAADRLLALILQDFDKRWFAQADYRLGLTRTPPAAL